MSKQSNYNVNHENMSYTNTNLLLSNHKQHAHDYVTINNSSLYQPHRHNKHNKLKYIYRTNYTDDYLLHDLQIVSEQI